jgi:phospholipase C
MFENRSYDNVLGWLYNSSNQFPYNQAPAGQSNLHGLTGNETNPNPYGGNPIAVLNQATTTVNGQSYAGTVIPGYDPGETFGDMAQQIFGSGSLPFQNPYANPGPLTMQGFTKNYAAQPHVTAANIQDVMNYLTPAQVPVTAFLANNFAVCDAWYGSAPTQTFTNRMFAHCAAPAVRAAINNLSSISFVDDAQWFNANADLPGSLVNLLSIFSQLDAAYPPASPPNWKLYFHDYPIAMVLLPYVYNAARSTSNVNVATYDNTDWGSETPAPFAWTFGATASTFLTDIAQGTLPKLSFIEPRYSSDVAQYPFPPNSNHPGKSKTLPWLPVGSDNPPVDVACGEVFLMQLYNALRNSKYWNNTLLIITYDEHGGVYDHVSPPGGAANLGPDFPTASDFLDPAADGFNFNYFGCRVPAIIVSPYIVPSSTIRASGPVPFDHSSIVRTVWDCFDLSTLLSATSLTARDGAAPSLMPSLTGSNNTGPYAGPTPACAVVSSPNPGAPKSPEMQADLLKARILKSAPKTPPAPHERKA